MLGKSCIVKNVCIYIGVWNIIEDMYALFETDEAIFDKKNFFGAILCIEESGTSMDLIPSPGL